jgi:hypothetical protein
VNRLAFSALTSKTTDPGRRPAAIRVIFTKDTLDGSTMHVLYVRLVYFSFLILIGRFVTLEL